MLKETFYFPHDYEPTSDPKIQALVGEYGAVGYGVYWRVVEMLHSIPEHKIPLKDYIYIAIAKQMLADAKQIQAMLQYSIDVCELFVSDGEYFWSNRVNDNFIRRAEISEKRALAGSRGGRSKQLLSKSKQNVAKEKKGKEIVTLVEQSIDNKYELKKKMKL